MPTQTTNTPENLGERLRAKLLELCKTAKFEKGGFFSGAATFNGPTLHCTLTPFTGDDKYETVRTAMGTSSPSKSQKGQISSEVTIIMRECGFFPSPRLGNALEPEAAKKMVSTRVAEIIANDPEFKDGHDSQLGLFSISLSLGSGTSPHTILIFVRPYIHLTKAASEYVRHAYTIELPTGTRDLDIANKALNSAKLELLTMGLQERALPRSNNVERIIPASWIKLDRIKTIKLRDDPYFKIIIVSPSIPERLSIISYSTGVADEAIADRMKEALQLNFIPQSIEKNIPISLSQIDAWLTKQGYEKEYKVRKPASIPDIHDLPRGEIPRVRFFSPIYDQLREAATIIFAPWHEGKSPIFNQSSHLRISLNTTDPVMGKLRTNIVNQIAIGALERYFTAPETRHAGFVTEVKERVIWKKPRKIVAIRPQPDPRYALQPTIAELVKAIHQGSNGVDTALPARSLSESLYNSFVSSGINSPPEELQLTRSLSHALQFQAGQDVTGDITSLDAVMARGLDSFFKRYPHYQTWMEEGKCVGVEVNRSMNMDGDYIRDAILRPAVKSFNDFSRMVAWDISFAPANGSSPTESQVILLKAVKNPLEAQTIESADAPWDKSFTLQAASVETAQRFQKEVLRHLYRHQFESVIRPIDHFGATSQELVLRRSLSAGLRKADVTIPQNSHLRAVLLELAAS